MRQTHRSDSVRWRPRPALWLRWRMAAAPPGFRWRRARPRRLGARRPPGRASLEILRPEMGRQSRVCQGDAQSRGELSYILLRASNYKAQTASPADSHTLVDCSMGILRSVLLAGSQSRWLREHAPRYWFVRRTVSRFMPGESSESALAAAQQLQNHGIPAVFTHLGENITDAEEAGRVTDRYIELLDEVRARDLGAEVSVKLTQLGLDLSSAQCHGRLKRIVEHAGERSTVWIDMESSQYVDITLELYRRAR